MSFCNIKFSKFFNTHRFNPHPMGKRFNYGLNTFGHDSIIQYKDDIWKFYTFQVGSNNAIYYNKNNESIILNLYSMPEGITRMEEEPI